MNPLTKKLEWLWGGDNESNMAKNADTDIVGYLEEKAKDHYPMPEDATDLEQLRIVLGLTNPKPKHVCSCGVDHHSKYVLEDSGSMTSGEPPSQKLHIESSGSGVVGTTEPGVKLWEEPEPEASNKYHQLTKEIDQSCSSIMCTIGGEQRFRNVIDRESMDKIIVDYLKEPKDIQPYAHEGNQGWYTCHKGHVHKSECPSKPEIKPEPKVWCEHYTDRTPHTPENKVIMQDWWNWCPICGAPRPQ